MASPLRAVWEQQNPRRRRRAPPTHPVLPKPRTHARRKGGPARAGAQLINGVGWLRVSFRELRLRKGKRKKKGMVALALFGGAAAFPKALPGEAHPAGVGISFWKKLAVLFGEASPMELLARMAARRSKQRGGASAGQAARRGGAAVRRSTQRGGAPGRRRPASRAAGAWRRPRMDPLGGARQRRPPGGARVEAAGARSSARRPRMEGDVGVGSGGVGRSSSGGG